MSSIAGMNKWVEGRIKVVEAEIKEINQLIIDYPMSSNLYAAQAALCAGKLTALYDVRTQFGEAKSGGAKAITDPADDEPTP